MYKMNVSKYSKKGKMIHCVGKFEIVIYIYIYIYIFKKELHFRYITMHLEKQPNKNMNSSKNMLHNKLLKYIAPLRYNE